MKACEPNLAVGSLSLIGIFAGIVVLFGIFSAKRLDGFFPFHSLLSSHLLGILSLIALAIAVYARYSRGLAGGWRRTYAITAAIPLYLNVFVLIAQAFQKVPALKVLAPTQSEPPFLVTQLIVLVILLGLSVFAVKGFRTDFLRPA